MKRWYLLIALAVCAFTAVLAQQPKESKESAAQQSETQKEDVVRISVRLVQVDGTVTDKDGHQVTDLKKEDLELFVDGRQQQITTFAYIPAQPAPKPETANGRSVDPKVPLPPTPHVRIRPEDVRRTIALVLGNVSFEGMRDVKKALNKFVDEQMQPGDLVSIIRLTDGAGVLQQFTTDKRLLHIAIDHVRWNPLGRVGISAVEGANPTSPADEDAAGANDREAGFYEALKTVPWLQSINLIIGGLEGLPGRKSVILFSDGFSLFGPGRDNQLIKEAAQRVTDRATRALVVFNTLDARGLQPLNITAAENMDMDQPGPIGSGPLKALPVRRNDGQVLQSRRNAYRSSQDGLAFLADETGGRFMHDTDPGGALARLLNDQKGYYVIGYRPDEATFKLEGGRRPYHQIKVNVKRPGLQARFRKGFYGTPDQETPKLSTADQKVFAALTSPFDASEVGLKLTALFGYDQSEGPFLRSLLHINADTLTFTEEADGRRKAVINVFAAAFDEHGLVADPVAQKQTVRVRGESLERLKRDGLNYETTIPVKKTGMYQLRVAVQDAENEQVGSTSQFIEVPDANSNRLALTGIVLSGSKPPAAQPAATDEERRDIQSGPYVRRFHAAARLAYAFILLNAQVEPATQRPQVQTQIVLYRDGKPVYEGPVKPVDLAQQTDFKQILVRGALDLKAEFGPGEYVFQVIVTDNLAKEKKARTATRWIDFDVVE